MATTGVISRVIYEKLDQIKSQGEYVGETGINRQKLRDRVRIYRRHIRQPKYQMLKVEEHLRNCGNGQFKIFPFLKMRSKDTELRRTFEERSN